MKKVTSYRPLRVPPEMKTLTRRMVQKDMQKVCLWPTDRQTRTGIYRETDRTRVLHGGTLADFFTACLRGKLPGKYPRRSWLAESPNHRVRTVDEARLTPG